MKNLKLLMSAALIACVSLLYGQETIIAGVVKNAVTGDPISGANIEVESTQCSSVSNDNGNFKINCKIGDSFTVHASHISFKQARKDVLNNANEGLVPIEILMYPETQKLHEVEVTGAYVESVPYNTEEIDLKKLDETNLTDIGKLLTGEPNIGGIRKGAVGIDPVIRGFKYSQVTVQLNEGTKIEGGCPNRMDPSAAHVNINDLQSITVFKGPFALKYGPGFGGLVVMETFKPEFRKKFKSNVGIILGGQTNHEGYRSGIRIDGGGSRVAFLFTANRNKYGNYKSGNGDVFKASSDNYNITGTIGLKVVKGHTIKIGADRSWGKNVDFPTLPMDERSDDTRVLHFNYTGNNISSTVNSIHISAYNSDVEHEMDNKNRPFSDTVVAISQIHATNSGGRMAISMNSLDGIAEVGATVERITKNGNRYKHLIKQPGLPVLEENLWNNARITNIGAFAEYRFRRNKFDWIGAIRIDYNDAVSDTMVRLKKNGTVVYENDDTDSQHINFSASAGFRYELNNKVSLDVAIGKGTRSPDMTERFIILLPVGYDPYDYLGNPKLKPENNHELDIGIERVCSRSGQFNFSLFFSYVTDYISAVIVPPSEVKPQTKGVLGVKQFINIDKAYLTGFELKHATPAENRWQVRLSAAYTMGMNPEATKIIYNNGEATGEEIVKNDPLPEIPPFEANIWFQYGFFNKELIPEVNYRIVAKQSMISEAYYELETPGFNILNFKISYSYNQNLSITAGVNNIFNTNYYEHLSRRVIGSRTPFYEPGRIFYTNLIIKL